MSSEAAGAERLPGLLLVLSAPSGARKTTLAHRFRARHPEATFSISATTRPPRGAERDGVDYHFLPPERFEAMVRAGAFEVILLRRSERLVRGGAVDSRLVRPGELFAAMWGTGGEDQIGEK